MTDNTLREALDDDAVALEAYRAAIRWVAADSWDGCADCIKVLKLARGLDNFDWSPDEHAAALKRLYDRSGSSALTLPTTQPTNNTGLIEPVTLDIPSHEVDDAGKPTEDSDPWSQLGWHKERLAYAETEMTIWKERAMSLRLAALATKDAEIARLKAALVDLDGHLREQGLSDLGRSRSIIRGALGAKS